MKGLIRIWKIVVFTNVLIACAAAAQVALSYAIFQIPVNYHIVILEFCATLLLYNLSIWLSKPKNFRQSPYERTRWIFGNVSVFWTLNSLALLFLIYLLPYIHFHTLLYLGFIGIVSLAYALPIIKVKGEWKSFRHIPYMKVFHISLIWSLSTVGLVYVESSNSLYQVGWPSLLYLLGCKFLFILLVTLPFDIRDMKQDSYYHLKTLPLVLGRKNSELFCYFLTVFHIILILFMPSTVGVKVGLIACDILVLLFFRTIIFKNKESFLNVYLLDLILVLQYIICFLALQITDYLIH